MAKASDIDPELLRVGEAVKALRERLWVTQAQAADVAEPQMTAQYWGMHETGRVPGIFKPAVQRKLIEALNRAAAAGGQPPAQPLTTGDLDEMVRALAADPGGLADPGARFAGPEGRAARLARELDRPDPNIRRGVFPTADGDTVIEIPASLTPEGFKQVEAYLAVFLQANAPKP